MEGSFHIHVHDLCLDVGAKLTSTIHVSTVNIIDVQVADKVGWVRGHKKSCIIDGLYIKFIIM